MKTEISYYLGIDGGGTKTEFVLADEEGKCLNRVVLGSCNPNDIGMEQTLHVLRQGIRELCEAVSQEKISVFAGIAGGAAGENGKKIQEFLKNYAFGRTKNGSDVMNAVAAFLGKKNGAAVIMGTGSIAFAQKEEKQFRVGGYGYLLGDPGSGFSIGRDGIAAALAAEDGSGPGTILQKFINAQAGGDSVWGQVSDFYKGGKREIASYAPMVFSAYEKGDPVASAILRRNMQGIAEMIEGCARYFPEMDVIPVVLGGGVTKQSKLFLPVLKEELNGSDKQYDIRVCTRSMVYGALLLAGMKESVLFEREE